MYTSSTAEPSGVITTNKIPNVKWLGWWARGRLEQRAFTAHHCYEENLSMARGKPQHMEMTSEINSIIKYAI